jgi:hypothetical protein
MLRGRVEMSLEIQAIKLKEQGLSAEEIAVELGLEAATVRGICHDDISDADFEKIREGLIELAINSTNEIVRARTSIFLWEQKRGVQQARTVPTVNVLALNAAIKNAEVSVSKILGPSFENDQPNNTQ